MMFHISECLKFHISRKQPEPYKKGLKLRDFAVLQLIMPDHSFLARINTSKLHESIY